MLKNSLTLFVLLFVSFSVSSQTLNWHLSAQAGTANHHFENFQGAFLTGFKTPEGQMLSVGPVFKGYSLNTQRENILGGRIYSQAKMVQGLSFYLQADVFGPAKSSAMAPTSATSTMRLETGAGLIYTYRDVVGLSVGYNLGELNPINGLRKNTPSLKLVYLVPFGGRSW